MMSTWTLIIALVAAFASSVNLWWQFADRRDRYILRWGRLWPGDDDEFPGFCFYVVNVGKHDITMLDYGFVYTDGRFQSLVDAAHSEWVEQGEHHFGLLQTLKPHRPQQASGFIGDIQAAYSISATQSRPSLAFRSGIPLTRRLALRAQVFILGDRVRRSRYHTS